MPLSPIDRMAVETRRAELRRDRDRIADVRPQPEADAWYDAQIQKLEEAVAEQEGY